MKIEFNQEELVEGILLLLEEQGFKKDNFIVQNFRFVSGRGENGDRVEVELCKKLSTSIEPEKVNNEELAPKEDDPFKEESKEENNSNKKTVGDLFQ